MRIYLPAAQLDNFMNLLKTCENASLTSGDVEILRKLAGMDPCDAWKLCGLLHDVRLQQSTIRHRGADYWERCRKLAAASWCLPITEETARKLETAPADAWATARALQQFQLDAEHMNMEREPEPR